MARALLHTLVSTVLLASCLLLPLGTCAWPRAWVLIGIYGALHAAGTIRIVRANHGLLRERAKLPIHSGQPLADRFLLPAFMAAYAGLPVFTALDVWRWHFLPAPPRIVSYLGLLLFAAGWGLVMRALETNAFAVTVVRHQSERGHTVVDVGVYRLVRHPMYAGLLGAMFGAPLWLLSSAGLIFALVPAGLLVLRIHLEELTLKQSLPEYEMYTQRVRHRLIPLIW